MNTLDHVRAAITNIDKQLLELLAQRRQLSLDAAKAKYPAKLPLQDPKREAELLQKLCDSGKHLDLSPDLIQTLYQVILKDSLSYQRAYVQTLSHLNTE